MFWKTKDDAPVAVIEDKPLPIKVQRVDSELIESYMEDAIAASINLGSVQLEKLKWFLADNNIPIYDVEQVHKYLCCLSWGYKTMDRYDTWMNRDSSYVWVPVRKQDCGDYNISYQYERESLRFIDNSKIYNKQIPHSVIGTIRKINDVFPDAKFFVSEIRVREIRDPFLTVAFENSEMLVIDFWAEPGFQPK